MVWLTIAVVLLLLIKQSMEIYNTQDRSIQYRIWDLIRLPYSLPIPERQTGISALPNHRGEVTSTEAFPQNGSHGLTHRQRNTPTPVPTTERRDTASLYGSHCITIRILMPSNFGLLSWRWYESVIETLAVVIYLYATFVLTSTVFFNADRAMLYATAMTFSLSGIRIVAIIL